MYSIPAADGAARPARLRRRMLQAGRHVVFTFVYFSLSDEAHVLVMHTQTSSGGRQGRPLCGRDLAFQGCAFFRRWRPCTCICTESRSSACTACTSHIIVTKPLACRTPQASIPSADSEKPCENWGARCGSHCCLLGAFAPAALSQVQSAPPAAGRPPLPLSPPPHLHHPSRSG